MTGKFFNGKNSFLLSSNVNEVIRAISNFFIFFKRRGFTRTKSAKSQKRLQANKNKKAAFFMRLKISKGKKVAYSLICVFVLFMLFVLSVLFVHVKYFCKKKKKSLKLPQLPHLNNPLPSVIRENMLLENDEFWYFSRAPFWSLSLCF